MRSWRLAIIITLLSLPGLLPAAQIAFNYNTAPRTIRACTLLLTNSEASNANPYMLPVLARSALKPPGWSFVNPLAPTQVTQDMLTRWGAGLGWGIPLGWPAVPPEWPEYWEVVLTDDSAAQLSQFDLIYIASSQDLNVTSAVQIAGLRRAVENGAVLWVDNAGGKVTSFPVPRPLANTPPPYAPFTFKALGGSALRTGLAGAALLSYPYQLSTADVWQLGENPPGAVAGASVADSGTNDVPLAPVVTSSGTGAGIAAARYGEGAIVVTAEGVGASLEAWFLKAGAGAAPSPLAWNASGEADPNLAQAPDVELGYNIANFTHASGEAAGGTANRSLEFAPAHPPLDLLWQFPPPWGDATLPVQPGPIVGSPVVYGGYVYVLSTIGAGGRTPALWCLQGGNYANGYRVVWSQPLYKGYTPRASSPTIAAVTSGGVQVPVVLVSCVNPSGGAGDLSAYNAVTGADLWDVAVPAYAAGGAVVDLSSPVAYKNWLFLLATEYDPALAKGTPVNGTYGRVWALQWSATGTSNPWVYPDSARSEMQNLLPPSHDPTWASTTGRSEIPPEGDVRPAVTTSPRNPLGLPVDAALVIAAPARMTWAAPNITTDPTTHSEYCLVPTPTDAAGAPLLNVYYYLARLNTPLTSISGGGAATVNGTASRNDGSTPPTPPVVVNTAPYYTGSDLNQYAQFGNVTAVLRFLATPSVAPTLPGNYDNPLVLRSGCRVGVTYNTNITETHYLPGPVLWDNETDVTGVVHAAENSGQALACGGNGVAVLNTENGQLTASWKPDTDSPLTGATVNSAPALEAETAWVASNAGATGQVHGVRTQADLSVHLTGGGTPPLADSVGIIQDPTKPVSVTLLATGATVAATNYDIDYVGRVIRFHPSAGATVGGQALLFTWTDSNGTTHTNEFHVVPRLDRFEYVGGYIRLRYYPVVAGSITVTLADGGAVTGWTPEATQPCNLPGIGATTVLPNGWLNLSGATEVGSGQSVIGKEVLLSYTGWSEPDYAPVAVGNVPAQPLVLPAERQQVPVGLGVNNGGLAVAGQTAIIGGLAAPSGAENKFQTLVSLFWDPISHFVQGWASQPAYTGTNDVPGVLSATATAGGQVYVSSAGVSGVSVVNNTPIPTLDGTGWLGALGPRRTLICDGNRLVETTGSDRTWVLTGSKAYIYGRTAPEPELTQPFSRPAKASALSDGTFLVVDTGNNRVIAVDRTGQQVWPLDQYGNDYYSSPSRADTGTASAWDGGVAGNYNLKLSQPADAYQYTDANGLHTVIADTGHNRVVDVITTVLPNGGQQHTVVDLTPAYVRPPWDPTHRYNLSYTRAQPIFGYAPGTNGAVIGYLCAAANIDRVVVVEAGTKEVDPAATKPEPDGSGRTWADWLALYNAPAAITGPYNTSNAAPPTPTFPDLRDVEYFRYGNLVYVLVTAGGMTDAQHGVSVNQDGVWEWEINTSTGPVPPAVGVSYPANWSYTATNYASAVPFSEIVTPAGVTYPKRFYPVCAKMLFPGLDPGRAYNGNVLITNYTGVTENLARPNVGSPGSGLFGEVFEVNSAGVLLPQRIIPDPFGTDWNDPLNQPAYAERY